MNKEKSKVLAGVLAVIPLTGMLGIHRFYLGYSGLGWTHIILLVVGAPLCLVIIGFPVVIGNIVWAIIEGIMIFAGSISKDASGNPLK